jgi:putative tryptophan/tyrosine transport system substrate-binding protein
MPSLSHVAVLWNPGAFGKKTTTGMVEQAEKTARGLDLQLQYVEVRGPDEFESALADVAKAHADALFLFPNPTFFENRKRLVGFAAQHRLPAMYNAREFVELGGLIAYGAKLLDLNRRTAIYVDKILKGAKPADLPVEDPRSLSLPSIARRRKCLVSRSPRLYSLRPTH